MLYKSLKLILIAILILVTHLTSAQEKEPDLDKFEKTLSKAYELRNKNNSQYLLVINQAIDIALKMESRYEAPIAFYELHEFFYEKNNDIAKTFLEFALLKESQRAHFKQGVMYLFGNGIPKDVEKAAKYLDRVINESMCDHNDAIVAEAKFLKNLLITPEISYEIVSLKAPQNTFKKFEDSGFTFNFKNSKEFEFKFDSPKEEEFTYYRGILSSAQKETNLPLNLTAEQLEKVKDKPALAHSAYVQRPFSDYKEDGSDEVLLESIEKIKASSKTVSRKIDAYDTLNIEVDIFSSCFSYSYIGELSNGMQIIDAWQYRTNRVLGFYATKDKDSKIDIESQYLSKTKTSPNDQMFINQYFLTKFYIDMDTFIEQRYDYTFTFYTPLSEEQFRKTTLPKLLEKLKKTRKDFNAPKPDAQQKDVDSNATKAVN